MQRVGIVQNRASQRTAVPAAPRRANRRNKTEATDNRRMAANPIPIPSQCGQSPDPNSRSHCHVRQLARICPRTEYARRMNPAADNILA